MPAPPASRLSVVIPCLDEGALVRPALRALQPLRAQGCELLLVDGGSRDGSPELAANLVDRLLKSKPGRARQMNAGASHAAGEILWFLHLDSQVPADAPRLIRAGLARSGRGWGRFDIRLSGDRPSLHLVAAMMNMRSRLSGIATGDQGIFVRRDWFQSLGGYAEIPLMEDIEFSRRCKRRGPPLCIRGPLVTSSRRWERDGVWRTVVLMWRLRLAYFLGADPAYLARRYRPVRFPSARILIFAKAPQVGRVKTRLMPRLGAEGACRLYAGLLERRVRGLADAGLAPVECWCTPDAGHPLFRALERESGVVLRVQTGGDLGARMQAAAAQALQQAEIVLLIGVDCPALTPRHLARALEWLRQGADAVLGPAEDGGYVLLGLRRAAPALFAEMPWGSERVLAMTRKRMAALGWNWRELETLWDLDRPADYQRLLASGWVLD